MPVNRLIVTVSQLNTRVSLMFKKETTFTDLYVRGEISDFKHHHNGNMYFYLKDESYAVKAIMFKTQADKVRFTPTNGLSVIVRCSVKCYEKEGIYQLYVSEIIPEGAGERAVALEQLKTKLETEGLFARKRPLPKYPKKICVITAETGAALQDILKILNRRYPICSVILVPVLVQGDNAPDSIANGFALANKTDADVIIFGRGGGSSDDLSAFNTEKVVRAVFNSSIPTISAVGHETDTSLSDYTADLRVATPSDAAEMAVPDINELISSLDSVSVYLKQRIEDKIKNCETATELVCSKINANSPLLKLEKRADTISELEKNIKRCITDKINGYEFALNILNSKIELNTPLHRLENRNNTILSIEQTITDKFNRLLNHKEQRMILAANKRAALNPLDVLLRGYSIVYKDKRVISSPDELDKGDKIEIRLNNGFINATVD